MKIFILTSRFPYPLEKGDKLRIFHQIRFLAQQHEVVLCALNEEEVSTEHQNILRGYVSNLYIIRLKKIQILKNLVLAIFSSLPFQVAYFFDKNIKKQIIQIIQDEHPDHLFCQLIRCAEYLKDSSIPKTIDYMDAFSKGYQRRIEHSSFFKRLLLKIETKRIHQYEKNIFNHFDKHCIISIQDKQQLPVRLKHNIAVIPNGVDIDYFKSQPSDKKQFDLVFIGNLGYPPNIIAAKYIVNKILPILIQKGLQIKILIAGARPTPEINQLASNNVSIQGWVKDIRTAYSSGKIFVAPLFTGSGLQNKILEAMAMGIPCITTPLVNQAINAEQDKSICLANTAEEFAARIIFLLNDSSYRKELSKNALTFVHENYQWKKFVDQLSQLIRS